MPFRTAIKTISPGFFRTGTGERYMYTYGLVLDALMQKMVEGTAARWPLRCAPAFLPIIGSDRLINQGLSESTGSYRVRLQKAFEAWQLAGSARAVMTQELGFLLSFTPRMRVVSSRYSGNIADVLFVTGASNASPIEITVERPNVLKTGDTVTIWGVLGNTAANTTTTIKVTGTRTFTLDGSTGSGTYTSGGQVASVVFPSVYQPTLLSSTWFTYAAGQDPQTAPSKVYNTTGVVGPNWDWDSLSQVTGSWSWWGSWLIISATAPQNWTDPPEWSWDGTLNASGVDLTWDTIPGSWGLSATAEVVQSIRAISDQWKAAHTWIRWIIVSFDDGLFLPTVAAGGGVNPDGTFGRWSKVSGGAYVPSRFDNAEYCDGAI